MMEFRKYKLGEILTESKVPSLNPDPNKRITVRLNVQGVEKRPLTSEVKGATKQYIRSKGQFIYGKQNFHKGAFGIIPEELDGYETSSDIPSFDVDTSICSPEFIYYFFKSGNRYLTLTSLARGVGSKRIHPKDIFELEIPIPSLENQIKVIEKLNELEAKGLSLSSELSTQLSLISQLRQSFLREAMEGKLVSNATSDGKTGAELLEKIKVEKERLVKEKKIRKPKKLEAIKEEEVPFEIPENWVWCRLGEIALYSEAGKSYKGIEVSAQKDQIGVIKTSAITSGFFVESENKLLLNQNIEIEKIKIEKGDIIFCRASGSKGLAGKSCLVLNTPKTNLILSDKSIRYVFSKQISKEFIHYYNSSIFVDEYYRRIGTTKSTSMNNITREQFNNIPIPLPPLEIQSRIVSKLNELMAYCDELEQSVLTSQEQNELLLEQVLREALAG